MTRQEFLSNRFKYQSMKFTGLVFALIGLSYAMRELIKPLNESNSVLPVVFFFIGVVVFLINQWIWEKRLND